MNSSLLKRVFWVVFIVINGICVHSQSTVYNPFPAIGRWDIVKQGPFPNSSINYYWYRYQTAGDTIVGTLSYKKVTFSKGACCPPNITYGPPVFSFAFRNDSVNRKVYIFVNIGSQFKDTLWYDFNLKVGDTLKSAFSNSIFGVSDANRISRYKVFSIDSILICGNYNKRFHFCGSSSSGSSAFKLDLIEGIGFEDNFVQTDYIDCPFEPNYLFETQFFCSLASIQNQTISAVSQLELFPNPVLNTFDIDYSKQSMVSPINFSIIDCLGKVIVDGTSIENRSIDVSGIESGMYFLMVRDKQKKFFLSKFVKQ